jgi:3-oxoacyl-[acyl-carrier protein] reductase
VRAVFVATQAAIKHMKEGARIINIGSTNAERMPSKGGGVHAMSKSALQGLVKGLARDLGSRGDHDQQCPTWGGRYRNESCGGRIRRHAQEVNGTAAEIAGMVAYLANPEGVKLPVRA